MPFDLLTITSPDTPAGIPKGAIPTNQNLASEFCERIVKMANEFDSHLDPALETGIRLVSFGQTVTIHVLQIGYYNPSLIRFLGLLEDGSPVELIQHVSQISFLLTAVRRLTPETPKKPIGFMQTA